MLREFAIRGLGVIEEARLDLGHGLSVLTGETGAGKTMVVTGLALLFGGRGDPNRVRAGAARLSVEGRLDLPAGHPVWDIATLAGAEPDEDGALIVSRTVSSDGRSRAYLGGRSVPVAVLAEVAACVWALHGQGDQLRLRRSHDQRAALDRFAGAGHGGLLAEYRTAYQRWHGLEDRLSVRSASRQELARAAELLREGIAEIATVDPKPAEDGELNAVAARLANAEQLRGAAEVAHAMLAGDRLSEGTEAESDALGVLARARTSLERAGDQRLRELGDRVAAVAYSVTDIAADLASYVEDVVADPARLAAVQERVAVLQALVRRFAEPATGSDGVLAWARDAEARLLDLDVSEDALQALRAERAAARATVGDLGGQLSTSRRAAAAHLSAAVTRELAALAMPSAGIEVAIVTDEDEPGSDGMDEVSFLLTPHAGSQPVALHRAASGGELSRVMLAVEVVLAATDPVPLLVFDEIDAGVGGQAAVQIGRRLGRLAAHHQVIVVTHLPQVAAFGDTHFVVEKTSDGRVTASGIHPVGGEERVQELSRMLAGLPDSHTGIAHAAELLASASDPG